jgi:hypothetical protein
MIDLAAIVGDTHGSINPSRNLRSVAVADRLILTAHDIVVGVFLFVAVDWLEPNRRLASVFKCAILAAGGAVIARHLLH